MAEKRKRSYRASGLRLSMRKRNEAYT